MDPSIPFNLQAWQLEQFCNLLAKIGMVTVCGLILTPVPNFIFCGLSQKEKESRIQSFSFSFLLFGLLNNLIWLAYSQKVDDLNIGIPAVLGCFVGIVLITLYLGVKSTRAQIIACFLLVSIAEFFFSSVIPAFITGSVASFLSISTYFSTLGQIPLVIRERDSRYINLPIVLISLINSSIWSIYASIKNDIPLFTTNVVALFFMLINMTFYLWALDFIPTEKISTLITIFKIAFPDNDLDLKKELGIDGVLEIADPELISKQAYFRQMEKEMGIDDADETTRLTQSGSESSTRETAASMTNPYLYTETFGEESKTIDTRPPEVPAGDSCGRGNESSLFLFDESTIADINPDELNSTNNSIKDKEGKAGEEEEESQQSGTKKADEDSGNATGKHEVLKEDDSCFDFQIEELSEQSKSEDVQ